jgi:hypothetical protein
MLSVLALAHWHVVGHSMDMVKQKVWADNILFK